MFVRSSCWFVAQRHGANSCTFWASRARFNARRERSRRPYGAARSARGTVSHGHAVKTARTLLRSVVDGEDRTVAFGQRHYLGPRLHARPLLGEHEFAAGELVAR